MSDNIPLSVWIKQQKSAEKSLKTEDLFTNLEYAKFKIQEAFSNKYFDEEIECYWLGEVLAINDYFVDLENIKYSLENSITEKVLFDYLKKPRNFNLADFILGKTGRKEKRKQELKKCKERTQDARRLFENNL
jgi:hypothetical protein